MNKKEVRETNKKERKKKRSASGKSYVRGTTIYRKGKRDLKSSDPSQRKK
jgi:hypothetical protein